MCECNYKSLPCCFAYFGVIIALSLCVINPIEFGLMSIELNYPSVVPQTYNLWE